MTTLAPYNWLRKVPGDFKKLAESPLFGNPPEFNIQAFAKAFAEALHLDNIQVKTTPLQFKDPKEMREGFLDCEEIVFNVAPLAGLSAILIPKKNFDLLIKSFADEKLHHSFSDEAFHKSFTQFISLELLYSFQVAFPDKNLVPQLDDTATVPEDSYWCEDMDISWSGGHLLLRLIFNEELRQSWKDRYNEKKLVFSKEFLSTVSLNVHAQVGRTSLSRNLWNTLQNGDYLVLDSCQFVPGEDKGRVLLTVNQVPAFRAKVKAGTIKILEMPQINELGTPMSTPPNDDENEELPEEMEEELDLDDLDDADDHEESDEVKQPALSHKPFKADDIPLDIIVEVGRFQMTVQKLSELQPGNVVDLEIYPENGVDLVINGTCVAKGELLKVGDTLGVRILDIAK